MENSNRVTYILLGAYITFIAANILGIVSFPWWVISPLFLVLGGTLLIIFLFIANLMKL